MQAYQIELSDMINEIDGSPLVKAMLGSIALACKIANEQIEKEIFTSPFPYKKIKRVIKEGGIVKENKSGEFINLPEGSQVISHDIAEKIAKRNGKINLDVKVPIDKLEKIEDIYKGIKRIDNERISFGNIDDIPEKQRIY
jgi:hypothetical protein